MIPDGAGSVFSRKAREAKIIRESDQFIVVRGRESRPHGEGTDSCMRLTIDTYSGQSRTG
jgi:hypothetical protein